MNLNIVSFGKINKLLVRLSATKLLTRDTQVYFVRICDTGSFKFLVISIGIREKEVGGVFEDAMFFSSKPTYNFQQIFSFSRQKLNG